MFTDLSMPEDLADVGVRHVLRRREGSTLVHGLALLPARRVLRGLAAVPLVAAPRQGATKEGAVWKVLVDGERFWGQNQGRVVSDWWNGKASLA